MKELSQIQKTLNYNKSQFNAFGKYHYRNCEDILGAVKPLLGDCILTLTDSIEYIDNRFYVKATATLTSPEGVIIQVAALARAEETEKGMDDAYIYLHNLQKNMAPGYLQCLSAVRR